MHKEKGLRVVRLAEKCPSLKRCVLAQMLLVTQQQGKCRCRAVAHSEKLSIAQSATRRGLRTKRVSQKDGGKSLFHHSQKVKKYKNSFFFQDTTLKVLAFNSMYFRFRYTQGRAHCTQPVLHPQAAFPRSVFRQREMPHTGLDKQGRQCGACQSGRNQNGCLIGRAVICLRN